MMFFRFQFEAEFYPTMSRIPTHLRMKLDVTGIKVSLKDWSAFSVEERWALCNLPVETEEERNRFSSALDMLMLRYKGEEAPRIPLPTDLPWEDQSRVPSSVLIKQGKQGKQIRQDKLDNPDKNEAEEGPVSLEEWARWSPCRRYALLKLSITRNEPEKFYDALREFRQGSG